MSTTRFQVYGAGEEFAAAAKSGDRKRMLELLRDHLADRIADGVAARDLAALARQLRDITEELEKLDVDDEPERNAEDELAERRSLALSAAGVDSAAESGVAGP